MVGSFDGTLLEGLQMIQEDKIVWQGAHEQEQANCIRKEK